MAQINLRQADVFKRNIAGYLKSNSLSNSVQISVYDPNSGNTIANARADLNGAYHASMIYGRRFLLNSLTPPRFPLELFR